MLTQAEADALIAMSKWFVDRGPLPFPLPGEMQKWEVFSEGRRESFLVDVNRKGKIKLTKCTYQGRYRVVEILLRLDVDGPPHENPDGTEVPTPHLHVYREGFGDKWAMPLPIQFTDTSDLAKTFGEFLKYFHVQDIPEIQRVVL